MSTAAVMACRDEADIVDAVVRHTLGHVDELLVCDHRSTDGTADIIEARDLELLGLGLLFVDEREGFHGDEIRTRLAQMALRRGHDWLLVVDADDVWHVTHDPARRISHYLADAGDALVVSADSLCHVPTAEDPDVESPLERIGWRRTTADSLKVACRLRPDLVFRNHNAWYGGELAAPSISRGLTVRHFTIRSADQLLRKVRNGLACFAAEPTEGHDAWDAWEGLSDEEIRAAFLHDHWSPDPTNDPTLVYDPAPLRG